MTVCSCSPARTTEGRRPPELLPDCCACGTAKYEMTFEGRWSQATHPKDYPTRQYHQSTVRRNAEFHHHVCYYAIMAARQNNSSAS